MHHSNHLLILPLLPDDLHTNRDTLHGLSIIQGCTGMIDFLLQQFGAQSRSIRPFLCKLIFCWIDSSDRDDADGTVDYVVQDGSDCQRGESRAISVADSGHSLDRADDTIELVLLPYLHMKLEWYSIRMSHFAYLLIKQSDVGITRSRRLPKLSYCSDSRLVHRVGEEFIAKEGSRYP